MVENQSSGDKLSPSSSQNVPLDELLGVTVAAPHDTDKTTVFPSEDEPRAKAATALLLLENEKVEAEIDDIKSRTKRDNTDHENLWLFRKLFGVAGFVIVVLWQLAIFFIAYRNGNGSIHLAESVLIALVTTTTANVIGLLVIVMKFVFAPTLYPAKTTPDQH